MVYFLLCFYRTSLEHLFSEASLLILALFHLWPVDHVAFVFFAHQEFFAYLSDLLCASFILQSLLKSYVSLNRCLFPGSRLFSSICSGEKPYFADRVLFKLKVAFLISLFGLTRLPSHFLIRLLHGFFVQPQMLFHSLGWYYTYQRRTPYLIF